MKTIFISISNGHISRNFFRTNVFNILSKQTDLKLVIFVPFFKKEFYEKEFKKKNVIFEHIKPSLKVSKLESLIAKSALYLVDSNTLYLRHRVKYLEDKNYFKYFFKCAITKIFGTPFFVKKIVRYIDYRFCPDKVFMGFFNKYDPDLVFSPNIQKPTDVHLLKAAKQRDVFSVGLINSWDSITARGMVRLVPDKLIVHNQTIKKEAIKFVGVEEKDIFVSGMQHFDYYLNYKPSPYEEFCKKLGLDPKKRLILFCPPTLSLRVGWWEMVKSLSDAINQRNLPSDLQVVVRYMPVDNNVDLNQFPLDKNIVHDKVGLSGLNFKGKKSDWEWTEEDVCHLADSLYWSSLLINYGSTMTIDATAFNKPVINITLKNHWLNLSELSHFKKVIQTGGTQLVRSKEELLKITRIYLENPSLDEEGRKRITSEQCWKLDGRSGQRIASFILESLTKRA